MEQTEVIVGWLGFLFIAIGVYNSKGVVWKWLRRGIREIVVVPLTELGVVLWLVTGSLMVIMSMLMHLLYLHPETALVVPVIFLYRLLSHLYSKWLTEQSEPLYYLSEEWQVIIWVGLAGVLPAIIPTGSLLYPVKTGLIYVVIAIGIMRWLIGFFKSFSHLKEYHLYYLIYLCNVELYPLLGVWSLKSSFSGLVF